MRPLNTAALIDAIAPEHVGLTESDLGPIPTPATEAPMTEPWLTADERAERNA
ncbi:hypothetical protein [Demequina sp. SO4-18]|uniref:hypothetical protein n=1 Tax=Demequina sp. SO4-18 TaxID=3401026 RepID=UPI003B5CA424